MKYLDVIGLQKLQSFMQNVDCSDYAVEGILEAYSCKLAGNDKKLSRSLDQEVAHDLSVSPEGVVLSASPVGPLTEAGSRRTLIYLLLTMQVSLPRRGEREREKRD